MLHSIVITNETQWIQSLQDQITIAIWYTYITLGNFFNEVYLEISADRIKAIQHPTVISLILLNKGEPLYKLCVFPIGIGIRTSKNVVSKLRQ